MIKANNSLDINVIKINSSVRSKTKTAEMMFTVLPSNLLCMSVTSKTSAPQELKFFIFTSALSFSFHFPRRTKTA